MLSESNGKVSIMRVMVALVVLCMIVPPTLYAIRNNQPQVVMDFNSIILVLGALAGKGLQRATEKSTTATPDETTS